MYGRKKTNSIDQARLEIFVTKYKPKKSICFSQPNSSKEVWFKHNATCSKVLHQKIKWCIYVASVCTNSLRWNQHHIFLHHLVGHWMKTEHIASNGLKVMLHQRLLKWLRTILALIVVIFPILKYKDAYGKIMVTPISIIQPFFWFPLIRDFLSFLCSWNWFFQTSIWSYYEHFCNDKLCELDIMGSSHL